MTANTPALWTTTEIMRGSRLMADIRKPWAAPKLADEGREFSPRGLDVGAWVHVTQYGLTELGQVWSKTSVNGEVFVVLADQRAVRVCARAKHGHGCAQLAHPASGEQLVAA